jgi:ribonuclease-3
MESASELVRGLLAEHISQLSPESVEKDAKTLLQELAQSQKLPLPVYNLVSVEGEAHQQVFTVACSVELLTQVTSGTGASRRMAEQEAAAKALAEITEQGDSARTRVSP